MENKNFEAILRYTQEELYEKIFEGFDGKRDISYCTGNYLLVTGEAPVLLIAHLDTVHEKPVKDIVVNAVSVKGKDEAVEIRISSPEGIGGDDRCGVYGILSVYQKAEVKPWLLFVCDEECGCIGSRAFADHYKAERHGEILEEDWIIPKEFDDIKFLIEIDRKGKDDSVYYYCDNKEFETWVNSFGFRTRDGSYSDICEVAPVMGKAAVNLSSGYYNPHTKTEYIVEEELNDTVEKVARMVEESLKEEVPVYEYVEQTYNWSKYDYDYRDYRDYSGWYEGNDNYWDYDYEWDKKEYHTEEDYKERCIALDLGTIDMNYFISHNLNMKIWAEYIALLDYDTATELDALRDAAGDDGILDEFHRRCGSWKEYYLDMCSYYDKGTAYC